MAYSKKIKFVARVLMSSLLYQTLFPNIALALTTGPSQPEVQAFEPVGTTDMVDMFTGDFNYNIPLLDVEGYPVNISYHGGVGMEQEASWCGLGWSINPGVINRTVRGIPDDFKGDSLKKSLKIKPEKVLRAGMGGGGELVGVGDPILGLSANLGTNINISNYRGVSADFSFGAGVNLFRCVSAGINLGVGSQTGADIDYNAGVQFNTSQAISKDVAAGVGVNFGHGYNTRSGIKDMNFSISSNIRAGNVSMQGPGMGTTIPIGVKNYVPVITNSSKMTSIYARIKVGVEFAWCNLYGNINAMGSTLEYEPDGSRRSYGYIYAQDAQDEDIMDFTRDRDGMYNPTMQYLPPAHMTYDIYSVSGQGTGGSFRPFRNDIGSVFDPVTKSSTKSHSGQAEASIGWLFGAGGDAAYSATDISSGPWNQYKAPFTGKGIGSVYENVYFKQGGDLTAINNQYYTDLGGASPISGGRIKSLPLTKSGSASQRDARSNLLYYFDAKEASIPGVATTGDSIPSYQTSGFASGPVNPSKTARYAATAAVNKAKEHHISEFVQVQNDGRRYIYGIAAMNNIQKEVSFSIEKPSPQDTNTIKGLVRYNKGADDGLNNNNGQENYFSSTITPAFAHSYLLTSVLSADYADLTGNGPSEDDPGAYTKFNYSKKEGDYRWKAPIEDSFAQYNPGFTSDTKDDKASYVIGSREQWLLHSIESKNFVAEFYTSVRKDGKGVLDGISETPYNNSATAKGNSYQLDSIVLYNKHDRFINGAGAVPIKTVYFVYTNELCKGLPNADLKTGKLTLKKIYFKYGNSQKSMLSPYQFEYDLGDTTKNPRYSVAAKDRWGNYKPNNSSMPNYEYPFVDQADPDNDKYAAAWSLQRITLPSGGVIEVNYEADDYAYVQDKKAMEMFKVEGVGNTIAYSGGQQLYFDKNSPSLYIYFKRRKNKELSSQSFRQNYLKDANELYFNFSVRMPNNQFEQIKGYADVENISYCNDDPNSDYGFVKVKSVIPEGGGAKVSPMVYTTLNLARYNLPHILYPGADPDMGVLKNILAGLKQSFSDMVEFNRNPIKKLLEDSRAKDMDKTKSYIRLQSPGLDKIGGGHRVKSLVFYDSWNQLAGGNASQATYGKNYDYTIEETGYGKISSGVASYEPLIGGDENPFRMPARYYATSGSKWPPNDPIELYQESPIAESLLPGAVVGYRQVTVSSIHKDEGRSSQGIDVYKFCTAKEYPFEIQATSLDKITDKHKFGLFNQENILEVTQGYTLILNDMHGKPRATEHYVRKTLGNMPLEKISYQQFEYHEKDGKLNNDVDVLVYNKNNTSDMFMEKTTRTVGVDIDITIDSREKTEHTSNSNFNVNVNATNVLFVLVPIPLPFGWQGEYKNEFRSAVATKVVQQYGILHKVKSYTEGAHTTLTNEAYDPISGQAVVTSVNNEFGDIEYAVSYPAYWGHKTMGPSYENIGFVDTSYGVTKMGMIDQQSVITSVGLNLYAAGNRRQYRLGDELLVKYNYLGQEYTTLMWIVGFQSCDNDPKQGLNTHNPYCCPVVLPRYPHTDPNWVIDQNADIKYVKVIRSGAKNMLTESMLDYKSLSTPFVVNGSKVYLSDSLKNGISLTGRVFSDTPGKLTKKFEMPIYSSRYSGKKVTDRNITANLAAVGFFTPRIVAECNYQGDRVYAAGSRKAGVFNAKLLWQSLSMYSANDTFIQYTLPTFDTKKCEDRYGTPQTAPYLKPDFSDKHWKKAREVTKWSMYGNEIENIDAVGNYSSAIFGFNHTLPVALVYNARQEESMVESFEDYGMLYIDSSILSIIHSPIKSLFPLEKQGGFGYSKQKLSYPNGLEVATSVSHTGRYAFKSSSGGTTITFDSTRNPVVYKNQYFHLPFTMTQGKRYVLSCWIRPYSTTGNEKTYQASNYILNGGTSTRVSFGPTIIDKWQKMEFEFTASTNGTPISLVLPANIYMDDLRIVPLDANMKAFVYDPRTHKLMATMDENNYATIYEYDREGNLVRTKKETDRGIMTVSESRSANPKR